MGNQPNNHRPIPVIDLFAGAGGFTVAARQAGGVPCLSIEMDKAACETLEANEHGSQHHTEQADVRELEGKDLRRLAKLGSSEPLIIVGGPPCQPFSKASYWTDPGHDSKYRRARARGKEVEKPLPITEAREDDRRDLLAEFHRLIVEANADAFVMENVRSLLHPRNKPVFEAVLKAFGRSGYLCTVVDANAVNYGVAQKRKRIFVIGSKHTTPIEPPITHWATSKDPQHLKPPVAVEDVIGSYIGDEYAEEREQVTGRWADALQEIPPGSNYKHLTAWAGHENPLFEAETRFWNFLLKLNPKAPSWTINANPGPWVGPFHWESRRLRTVELAAIQSFPHGYIFKGKKRQVIRQIGNAVPSKMAKVMIESAINTVVSPFKEAKQTELFMSAAPH